MLLITCKYRDNCVSMNPHVAICNDIKVEQLGMAKEFWQNGVQDAVS